MADDAQRVKTANLEAVRSSARETAFDWYLSALLSGRDVRQDLITLAALTGEIEKTPLVVSDPALGEIRLRWWLDWLEELDAGTKTGNPVADLTGEMIVRRGLPRSLVAGLIEARGAELYALPFETAGAFQKFVDQTTGAVMQLAAGVVGALPAAGTPEDAGSALLEFGRAYGVTRQLVVLPQLAARGRWGLYPDETGDIDASLLLEPEVRARADQVRQEALSKAWQNLENARQVAGGRLSGPLQAGLPVAMVEQYLRKLQAQDDWLRTVAEVAPLVRVWTLLRARWTGRF
ncbi:MAG: squalene/phytoene synthase family protein [Filomicrobium sp.]